MARLQRFRAVGVARHHRLRRQVSLGRARRRRRRVGVRRFMDSVVGLGLRARRAARVGLVRWAMRITRSACRRVVRERVQGGGVHR